MDAQTIAANQQQQAQLYGRPLGQIVRELTGTLHLSQAKLAETLGMSAPMLSQLASGQRVKIGNPQVVSRLQALLEMAPLAATMTPEQITARLGEIARRTTTLTETVTPTAELARALRAFGSPQALNAAAAAAAPHSRPLAALLQQAADGTDRV